MSVSILELLDQPTYLYSEVDRLVRLPSGTARRWINGYSRSGKVYDPILRVAPIDSEWVTWGEFVETRMLAEFRDQKVPTPRLRAAVEQLRHYFQVAYPLAHLRPYFDVDNHEVAIALSALLPGEEGRAVLRTGQGILQASFPVFMAATLSTDEAGEKIAVEIQPDPAFPGIKMSPERLGGQPTFDGRRILVSTVANLVAAGDPLYDIAADYRLSVAQVQAAVQYAAKYQLAA